MKEIIRATAVLLTAAAAVLCVAVDPECELRKLNGLPSHWSNPSDCRRFYRCTAELIKREISCPLGKEYNARTGRCVTGGKGSCKQMLDASVANKDNVCRDKAVGIALPKAGYCRDFYVCYSNMTYDQSCDRGSFFDSKAGNCRVDVNGKCWQNKCTGLTNGTYLDDSNSCLTFYVCHANETVRQTCSMGSYFEPRNRNCIPDVRQSCWENYCLNRSNGIVIANNEDTHSYYVCLEGKPVAQECPMGSYFHKLDLNCQPDASTTERTTTTPPTTRTTTRTKTPATTSTTTLTTTPTTTPTTTLTTTPTTTLTTTPITTPTVALSTQTPTKKTTACPETSSIEISSSTQQTTNTISHTTQCVCVGGYAQGDLVPHPVSSSLFYICYGGKLIEQSCQSGNRFDAQFGACVRDANGSFVPSSKQEQNMLRTKHSAAIEDQRTRSEDVIVADENKNSSTILVSVNGGILNNSAEPQVRAAAVDDDDGKQLCTCPGGYTSGQILPHPTDCAKFYVCFDGVLKETECGAGNRFDIASMLCVPDTNGRCRTKNPSTEKPCTCPGGHQAGDIIAHPQNCRFYYICHDSKLIESDCGPGNRFDNDQKACVPDGLGVCRDICHNRPNNVMLPQPQQCNGFFLCLNGVATPGVCADNDWFDPAVGACVFDTAAKCRNPCANVKGYALLAHPNCNQFYICNNGHTKIGQCAAGEGFQPQYQLCLPGGCESGSRCAGQPDGTALPVPNDAGRFYYCLNGVELERHCNQGTSFDSKLGICLPEASGDCNQNVCVDNSSAIIAPTLSDDPSSFCFCRNGAAYRENCPNDYIFDKKRNICESNAPCDPLECARSADYTPFVNRKDSRSFCLCVSKTAVIVQCPEGGYFDPQLRVCVQTYDKNSSCDQSYCLDPHAANSAFPSKAGPHMFCYCHDGKPILKSCDYGKVFNEVMKVCLPDVPDCDLKLCINATADNGYALPARSDPRSFCYCSDSKTVTKLTCADERVFNPEKGICMTQTTCESGKYQQFQAVANPDVCNKYYFCFNGRMLDLACGDGLFYAPEAMHCLPNDKGQCDEVTKPNNCTCPGGHEEGKFLPHPTDCRKFYICADSILHEADCGEGNIYDETQAVCNRDIRGVCKQQPPASDGTCVGNYREGQMVPEPNDTQLYYVCFNAKLESGDCGPGNVFDPHLLSCIPKGGPESTKRSRSTRDLLLDVRTLRETKAIGSPFSHRLLA